MTKLNTNLVALLRHADATRHNSSIHDFDRPLTEQGKQRAKSIGSIIKNKLPHVFTILCSPSLRTKQTLTALDLTSEANVTYIDELYSGDVEDYLGIISAQTRFPVLLIGHNPPISQLISLLRKSGDNGVEYNGTMQPADLALLNFSKLTTNGYIGQGVLTGIEHPY